MMAKPSEPQSISPIKGRPMLQWVGKKPLEAIEYFPAQEKEMYGDLNAKEFNKLFWGDNLQVLSHLLKEYRGKINLVYIDPPFDSKADYIKKIKIRGQKIKGQQKSLLEEKQYTDIWENDEYLQFIYERLLLIKELLSERGIISLHCDYHKVSQLRLLLDEIFGEENFVNEIIWNYMGTTNSNRYFARKHDTILVYSISKDYTFNADEVRIPYLSNEKFEKEKDGKYFQWWKKGQKYYPAQEFVNGEYVLLGKYQYDVWNDIVSTATAHGHELTGYPTQKRELLLERVVKAFSKPKDLVLDCFCGSGTTLAVAQKLGRRWIGCDINLGAIQTTTKRLNQILEEQKQKKLLNKFEGLNAFKVYNVNDYEIFKNEIESKEIIMEMYGVEPIKQSYFDGVLDQNLVKVMPLNRVLNKMDIENLLKEINKSTDQFTPKTTTSREEETYEEEVLVIASGVELDAINYLKKENKTGVKVEIRDIQADKKSLLFKKPTAADVDVKVSGRIVLMSIKEFYSPILVQMLELENEKQINPQGKVVIEDFKQIIDSVCIDVNYNGKLFNAEIMDLPSKKKLVSAIYEYEYKSKGKYTLAIKIVDVLGEEYFETFDISIK
jgi:site-specific DNA-methyltransferase (adenine-specific)/adenine-specific DNA-methyltransferase